MKTALSVLLRAITEAAPLGAGAARPPPKAPRSARRTALSQPEPRLEQRGFTSVYSLHPLAGRV